MRSPASIYRVALLMLLSCSATCQVPERSEVSPSPVTVPLECNNRFGLVLIKVEVNGEPATFVLDTGSNRTILSTKFIHSHRSPSGQKLTPSKGSGYVGTAVAIKSTLRIGPNLWRDHEFLAMDDLPDISQSIGERVDGILGQDLLRDFQSVEIDFKNKRLVLSP